MRKGLDVDQNVGPLADKIAGNNFSFVGRYLKNLALAEVKQLSAADLLIVSIHERRGDRATFTAAQGTADAKWNIGQARAIGQPKGSAIYSGIDFDATPDDLPNIRAYFEEYVTTLAGAGFRGEAYGNGLALGDLLDRALITMPYLAGAMGWQGSQEFDRAARWAIRQYATITHPALGIQIDPCDAIDGDIGAWSLSSDVTSEGPSIARLAELFEASAADLQDALSRAGVYRGKVDGDWGPQSRAALYAWKAKQPAGA